MNEKFKIIRLGLIIIFIFSNVINGYAAGQPFQVGDLFTFTVTDNKNVIAVNGTDYLKSKLINIDGTNNFTVTKISNLIVNLTYNDENINKTAYAEIDDFLVLYPVLYMEITSILSAATTNETNLFEAPNATPKSNVSTILPMFASGNQLFYDFTFGEYDFSNTENIFLEPSYNYTTRSYDYSRGFVNNKYSVNFVYLLTKSKSTENFEYLIDSAFKLVIDMDRNIVTELYFKFNSELKLENATKSSELMVRIIENSTGGSSSLDLIPFLSMLVVVSIFVIIKRKRN